LAPVGDLELWFADCVVSSETPTNKQIAALVEGSKYHVGDLAAGDANVGSRPTCIATPGFVPS
jgi:hypothetical protein